jgi:transposase
MFFDELSNDEWARLIALVSDEPAVRLNRRGRPRAEPRIVANAVLWILTTGEPWSKLPGRYPSGPTCRRRFEEWQANGTLIEMVRLLSETGRTFAYIPEPAPPASAAKPLPEVEPPKLRDDTVRGVFWKSPESWQTAPGPSCVSNGWRPLGAMADITRQLAGEIDAESVANEIVSAADVEDTEANTYEAKLAGGAQHGLRDARDAASGVAYGGHAAHAFDRQPEDASHAAAGQSDAQGREDSHSPLWMSLAMPDGEQFNDARGYVIYVAAERVASAMYRAWAEIMKDGRRVERSGLIGPRFDDPQAARQFALEWAVDWIDRECGITQGDFAMDAQGHAAAAQRATVKSYATVSAPPGEHQAAGQPAPAASAPVTRPMPESAAAKSALPATAGNRNGSNGNGNPQAGTSSYPQHANAHHRLQLRRYPDDNSGGAAADNKSSDRFPPTRKLLSHVR